MKRRLLSLLLCALMVTGLLPGAAFAQDATDPVTYGYVRPDWDDTSDRYVDSTNQGVRTELRRAKGDNYSLQFASMQNGTVTILAPTNVAFTPDEGTASTAVTVEDEENVADGAMPVYRVGMKDFGSGKLTVTHAGGSFDVPVTVELPDYGFYTAPTPSEAAFVSGDFIFNGTNSLYLLPYGENVTITDPVFENSSHAALFDLTSAGAGWQISLKQDAVLNGEENLIVCFNHDGEDYQDERIWVSDSRGLAMAWRSNGQPSSNTFKTCDITKDNANSLFILYNGAVVASADDLVYDKTKLKITSQDNIPGFYNIESLTWGTHTISHQEDANAKLTIQSVLPEYGFYTGMQPDTEAYVEDFTFTGSNQLYLVALDSAEAIASVEIEKEDGTYVAEGHPQLKATKISDRVYEITVQEGAEVSGRWTDFRLTRQESGNYHLGIRIGDSRGLSMGGASWNNGSYTPNNDRFKSETMSKGNSRTVYLYCNGEMITGLTGLSWSDNLSVEIEEDDSRAYRVSAVGWGEGTITYTDSDNTAYTVKIDVQLPDYAFYTTPEASETAFVENNFIFVGNDHLYLAARNGAPAITSVQFEVGNNVYADESPYFLLTKIKDGVYEVTIKPDVELPGNSWYEFRVNNKNGWDAFSIGISDARGLTMAGSRRDDNDNRIPNDQRFKSDELSKGSSTTRFFFYQNELVTDLSLLSWSENLELSRSDDGSGAFEIRLNNWENGTITYKADPSATVTIKAALPSFGFYSTPSAAIDTYLDKLVLTSMDATKVYALFAEPEDPADISSYELEWRHNMAVEVSQTIMANNKILGYELTLSDFTGTDNVEFGVRYTNGSRWGINLSVETNIPGFDPENPFKGEGDVEGDIYEDIRVYRQVDEDGAPVGQPLRQLGMGNALPDRTFYVFAKGDVTFTENSLLIPEADEDLTTTRCVADDGTVYFQVVSVANAYLWRRIDFELYDSEGDRDPAWIHVNTAMPGEHQVRITYQGKEYIVGNVTDWNADLVQLGSGNLYFWSTGERLPVFDLDVGAVTEEIDPINGLIEYKPAPEINALLKIVNSGLYSYVGGELCAVDETNTDVYQVTQVGLQYTAQTKETIQDCTYYNIVTFTVGEDPTEYSFIHRHHMDATRKIVVDLTDEATRAVYDLNRNNNIDLDELHAILDKVDAENWDTATIKLPPNNRMRGLLVIDTKTVIVLEGNGSRLDGSIRVDTLPYLPHDIIRMECYSTIRGVANPDDVGVYGQGGADVKYCGFNGYHVGVKSYDISEDYYNENAHNPHAGSMKMVRNCRFAENYIGIWIEEGGANGWSTDSFGDSQFYHNGIAVWVENLEERWEVAHLIIFEECLFIDNGWDLVNRSQYRLTHWHCYFGRWPQTAGQPPIVDYTYAMTVEETADGTEDGEPDPDGLAKLAAVDPEDVTILAPVVEGDSISAPQVGSFELENGRLEINEEDLLVAGENASVNNENDAAFDVGAFDGKLDVQQPNGAQYDNIATWDFSKEDDK